MLTRGKKMANIQELKDLLDNIKLDLESKATNAKIDELLALIKEKDNKIDMLDNKVDMLEQRLIILEEKLEYQTKSNILLERKIDDGEQYLRRQNLRINGITCEENERESDEATLAKVKNEVRKLGIDMEDCDFDRAHRIGPTKKDENGRALPRPMIVRMTSWRARTLIYRNRKKDGNVKFYIDQTKRRFQLKKSAIEHTKNNPDVHFAFVDVNCNLCIRFKNGVYKFFNSMEELTNILQ